MLSAGIVGLPNVGKSTLFNAVTRTQKAQAANYPFCTIDPNLGIVTVPDLRDLVSGFAAFRLVALRNAIRSQSDRLLLLRRATTRTTGAS